MGALFGRVKTWVTLETVTYSDLNAEFNNVLDNLTAANVDDFSANVSQMQTTADPGEVGTESLATSVAGELSRLRHLIREISGEDEWYETPTSSLLGLANAIGTGLTNNRLVSGRVRSSGTNNCPIFLTPHGAAKTVTCKGSTTNFVYYVNGTEYTISTDVTLTGLTAAPSSQNTALINDGNATSDPFYTTFTGEDGTTIPIDNAGTEVTSLVGQFAAFKLAGAATEYLIAFVESSTQLTRARRGFFFDSSDAPIVRSAYTDNDTLTLMKLTWVFAKTDGTLTATYTNPVWSDDEPSSPALGDYWFDLSANRWMVYGVGSYSSAGAHLIGVCIQDTTNTVAARSFEFFANYDTLNTMELIRYSNTQVKSRWMGSTVNVWGQTIKCDRALRTWDISLAAHLDTGITESASTTYYCYLTDTGDQIITTVKPYDRREDLQGYYHPHSSWRCIGWFFNDGSSNVAEVDSYFRRYPGLIITPSQTTSSNIVLLDELMPVNTASAFTKTLPPAAQTRGRYFRYIKTSSDFNALTIATVLSETIIEGATSGTSTTINTQGEVIELLSNGTSYYVMNRKNDTKETIVSGITIEAVTTNPTKGNNPTTDRFIWSRSGRYLIGRLEFLNSTATGSATGTGDYLFTVVPSGVTIDTTTVTAYGGVSIGSSNWSAVNSVGSGTASISTSAVTGIVLVYDTTRVRIGVVNASLGGMVGSTLVALNNAASAYAIDFKIPISGWLP